MIIQASRIKQGFESTLSELIVDGKPKGYALEDEDRGLTSTMTLAQIAKIKKYGRTAIPTGRYRVRMTYSKRFGRFMPELLNVPGFGGIRLHKGNYIGDTEGCPLPGLTFDQDKAGYYRVWNSGKVFNPLLVMIIAAEKRKEEIWYEIIRNYGV